MGISPETDDPVTGLLMDLKKAYPAFGWSVFQAFLDRLCTIEGPRNRALVEILHREPRFVVDRDGAVADEYSMRNGFGAVNKSSPFLFDRGFGVRRVLSKLICLARSRQAVADMCIVTTRAAPEAVGDIR